jgi:hypothetical protein
LGGRPDLVAARPHTRSKIEKRKTKINNLDPLAIGSIAADRKKGSLFFVL